MFAQQDTRAVEDRRAVEDVLAQQDAQRSGGGVATQVVKDVPDAEQTGGIVFERCGGGRRRVRHRSKAE